MTYTYKLARRLARLRVPASVLSAALLAVGCNTDGELKQGFGPPPTASDTTVTSLTILPRTAQLSTFDSIQFSLYGVTDNGDSVPAQADWEATGGTVLPSGMFFASTPGTYRVTARGRGNGWGPGGPNRTDTSTVDVSNRAPAANANGPYSGRPDSLIQFSSVGSSDREGTWTAAWDFGDSGSGTGQSPTHRYRSVGTFTASLTVTDQDGATATDNATVTVADSAPIDQPPTANANGPYSGTTGTAVAFSSAGSFDPEGAWTASWDFGDGATGTGVNPVHSYTTASSYTVTLTVTDQAGQTASATATVTIAAAPPPNPGRPNEPPGYTRFFEFDFSTTLPAGYASVPGTAGRIWKYELSGLPDKIVNPITDATAPGSGPDVLRYRYPNGWTPSGASPAGMNWWDDSAAPSTGTQYKEIYESAWFNMYGAGDGTFENHAVGIKLFGYWGSGEIGNDRTPTSLFVVTVGDGATTIVTEFDLYMSQQNILSRGLVHNVNTSARLTVGAWHQYEMLQITNSVLDAPTGILKLWIDGVLWFDYSDIVYRTTTFPAHIWGRQMNPVYGGAGGTPKTRDDDVYWDDVYTSGKQ